MSSPHLLQLLSIHVVVVLITTNNWVYYQDKCPLSQQTVHDLMLDDASKDNIGEKKGSCYNPWTEHEVADKSVADCMEAIIGAYLLVCGNEAATSFLDWLGVGVFKVRQKGRCSHVQSVFQVWDVNKGLLGNEEKRNEVGWFTITSWWYFCIYMI